MKKYNVTCTEPVELFGLCNYVQNNNVKCIANIFLLLKLFVHYLTIFFIWKNVRHKKWKLHKKIVEGNGASTKPCTEHLKTEKCKKFCNVSTVSTNTVMIPYVFNTTQNGCKPWKFHTKRGLNKHYSHKESWEITTVSVKPFHYPLRCKFEVTTVIDWELLYKKVTR